MRRRLSINKLLMYLTAISLLLNSSSMYFLTEPAALIPGVRNVQYILLAIFCLLGCFCNGKFRLSLRSLFLLMVLVIYLLLYLLMTRMNPASYLTKHVLIFVIFFLYCDTLIRADQFKEFVRAFVNVISVVAFFSLFFWLFGSVLGVIHGRRMPYLWAGRHVTTNYFWLYFETQLQNLFGRTVARNCGIFAESPGYSGFLIIALAIVIPSKKGEYSFRRKLLLTVTMLTTLSTKGQIALIVLFILTYMLRNKSRYRNEFYVKLIASTLLIVIALFAGFMIMDQKSTTGSYALRVEDAQSAIRAWMSHPLFGAGYQETESITGYFSVFRTNKGLSMGLTVLLAQGGIYMFAFYLGSFLLALITARHRSRDLSVRILIFGVMILFNLIISTFQYDPSTLFILACGYALFATQYEKSGYAGRRQTMTRAAVRRI